MTDLHYLIDIPRKNGFSRLVRTATIRTKDAHSTAAAVRKQVHAAAETFLSGSKAQRIEP
jgi:hypothetical protein